MDSSSADSESELSKEYYSIFTANYCSNAAAVFLKGKAYGGDRAILSQPICVSLLVPFHYSATGEIIPFAGCVEDDSTPQNVAQSHRGLVRSVQTGFAQIKLPYLDVRGRAAAGCVLVLLNALHLGFSLASVSVLPPIESVQDEAEPSLSSEWYRYKTRAISAASRNHRMTAILVQRFLLHLQSAEREALDITSSQNGSRSSSIVFDQVIGSLGLSLAPESFLGESVEEVYEEGQLNGEDAKSEASRMGVSLTKYETWCHRHAA
ncbi:hypothetical protein BD311DRAFT_815803 [Dichomitus squalens]|uniref:Uncharacterized protein n=1 Tax=Dichomitus squalens TaxID=114155 RepID=A0A4Q9MCS9_9APHY|nr:hypothetical protein BD311DRAFT_815803 [Dichomitus squalens]